MSSEIYFDGLPPAGENVYPAHAAGVTTNSSMLAGQTERMHGYEGVLPQLRLAAGHLPVLVMPAGACDPRTSAIAIARESRMLISLGFIPKIPVTIHGLAAIRMLAREGEDAAGPPRIAATLAFNAAAAAEAAAAGATDVCVFLSRTDRLMRERGMLGENESAALREMMIIAEDELVRSRTLYVSVTEDYLFDGMAVSLPAALFAKYAGADASEMPDQPALAIARDGVNDDLAEDLLRRGCSAFADAEAKAWA